MSTTATAIGCLLGAAGTALALVPRARASVLAGLALLAAGMGFLGYALVPGGDVERLVSSPLRIVAVAVAGLALALAGVVLARRPALVPAALLAVAPFRVPVELGDAKAFLLLPLYAMLAAAVVGLAIRLLREEPPVGIPRVVSLPSTAFIVLSAVSLLWSDDLHAGSIELLFFLFPFAVLVACVARAPLAAWTPKVLAITAVGLACGFAAVGLSQLWTEELYFARDLEVANAYTSYFRTTSLFADSSVYGRELALGIVVLVTALWLRRVRLALALAVIGFLWAALYFTYSQSTMVSLVVAVLVLSIVAADRLNRLILGAATFAAVAVGAVALALAISGNSSDRALSGRGYLIRNTWNVFVDHPGIGVGVGAQPKASSESGGRRQVSKNASHATPLTVAAELGVPGIAAYLALLGAAALALLEATRRDRALGLGLAACFLLLLAHSLLYSGFFENPTTWGTLAIAAALIARPRAPASPAPD